MRDLTKLSDDELRKLFNKNWEEIISNQDENYWLESEAEAAEEELKRRGETVDG